MQAPKEVPPDYQCKDKFLVQSVAAAEGTTHKGIVPGMVNFSQSSSLWSLSDTAALPMFTVKTQECCVTLAFVDCSSAKRQVSWLRSSS
jgi:hypothetical protein